MSMYVLYVAKNCKDCDVVVAFTESNSIECEIIDISDIKTENRKGVCIVPSLMKDDKVLAYGEDIISFFRKKSA